MRKLSTVQNRGFPNIFSFHIIHYTLFSSLKNICNKKRFSSRPTNLLMKTTLPRGLPWQKRPRQNSRSDSCSWMELMSTKVCDYRWLWQKKPGAINHQSLNFWKHYRLWFVFFGVPNFQPLTCDSKVSLFSWRKRRKMNCLILDILLTRGNKKRII